MSTTAATAAAELPEATREQEQAAQDLALIFDSVEVRMLHDGVAALIGRGAPEGYEGHRNFLVDEDGRTLELGERVHRDLIQREWATDRMLAIDPAAPDALDRLKAIARECERQYAQYDGRFDDVTAARAAYGLTTKGGLSQVKGDLVLVTHRDGSFSSVYSFRRCGFVSTPTGYLRAL